MKRLRDWWTCRRKREAEVKVKTVIDTLGNVEAFYCSILWLKD